MRCDISKKVIWFDYAYKRRFMFTGPGDPVFVTLWYDRDTFLVNKLKGVI